MDTFEIAVALFFVAAVLIPSMAVWHIRRQRQGDITHTANRSSSWARTALYTREQLIQAVRENLAAQQNHKGDHEPETQTT